MSKITEIIIVEHNKNNIFYDFKKIEEVKVIAKEKALSMSYLLDSYRKLMGRVLTTIDASITTPQQNKAIKDIIKKSFNDEIEFASSMVYDQEEMGKIASESFDALSPEEQKACMESSVDIEDLLNMQGKKLV